MPALKRLREASLVCANAGDATSESAQSEVRTKCIPKALRYFVRRPSSYVDGSQPLVCLRKARRDRTIAAPVQPDEPIFAAVPLRHRLTFRAALGRRGGRPHRSRTDTVAIRSIAIRSI